MSQMRTVHHPIGVFVLAVFAVIAIGVGEVAVVGPVHGGVRWTGVRDSSLSEGVCF